MLGICMKMKKNIDPIHYLITNWMLLNPNSYISDITYINNIIECTISFDPVVWKIQIELPKDNTDIYVVYADDSSIACVETLDEINEYAITLDVVEFLEFRKRKVIKDYNLQSSSLIKLINVIHDKCADNDKDEDKDIWSD